MQNVGVFPGSPGHVCLSLVAILVGILAMPGAEGTGTRYAWSAAHEGAAFADTSLQASAPPVSTRSVAQRTSEPGRLDVIEQPGRRGVTEQPSRSAPEPESVPPTPPRGPLRPVLVEALLNRQVTVPLVLDTGATYTMLTVQTAKDLGITGLERLPKKLFLTASGKLFAPVTTLKSIRVGPAEAQDVEVAIDTEGHLPMGLLGMTFLRHFKVTVDQEQAQVKFERR